MSITQALSKAAEHMDALGSRHKGAFTGCMIVKHDGLLIEFVAPNGRELRKKVPWIEVQDVLRADHVLIRKIEFALDEFLYGNQDMEPVYNGF